MGKPVMEGPGDRGAERGLASRWPPPYLVWSLPRAPTKGVRPFFFF